MLHSFTSSKLPKCLLKEYERVLLQVRHVSESVEARPMPRKVADLLRHKISDLIPLTTEAQPFDQLTVNEYPCGVGLSPHIDTHSAFGDVIISLSLASHAVMTFRCNGQQRTLFLPPRSLLIMAGECRFAWEHYIPHRKMDSVVTPGDVPKVVRRGERRISFTFRHTRKNPCSCPFPKICDSQDGVIPPTRNGSEALLSDMDGCQGGRKVTRPGNPKTKLETTNVHEVYDAIASHFSATRFAVWPAVKTFLEELPKGAIVADVGCGNGKYFGVRNDIFTTGSDRSTGLAAVAAKRTRERLIGSRNVHLKADVLVSDGLHLPYRDRSCNAVICIAVLHHLSSVSRRLQLLNELTRILAPNGMALVTVWATRQENMGKIAKWKQLDAVSKTIEGGNSAGFDEGTYGENDYLVPWHVPLNRAEAAATAAATVKASGAETTPRSSTAGGVVDLKKNTVVFQRYYHLFEADELQGLVQRVPGVDLIKLFYDKDNWCVVFRRKAE